MSRHLLLLGNQNLGEAPNGNRELCGPEKGCIALPSRRQWLVAATCRPTNRRGDTMKGARLVCPTLMAIAALTCSGRDLRAGDIYGKEPVKQDAIALHKPAEIQSLNAYPNQIALKGSEDAQQILVTATLAGNRLQD